MRKGLLAAIAIVGLVLVGMAWIFLEGLSAAAVSGIGAGVAVVALIKLSIAANPEQ